MFGSSGGTTGSSLGRSASFSFSQPPANKPFSGTSGGFSFGGGAAAPSSTANTNPSTSSNTAAAAAAGFSFGQKPAASSTAAAPGGGGLFGASNTGSLFGNPSTSQPSQQGNTNANTSSNSLFGNKPSGGFSFGASANTSTNPATNNTSGGGFGGGGFGSTTNTGTGGLFGANNSSTLIGGGGLFGQQPQQQQQQQQPPFQQQQQSQQAFSGFQQSQSSQQQQPMQSSPFYRFAYYQKERFNDLPEEAKRLVEELDRHISSQLHVRDELKTKDFGAEIRKCASEWHQLDSAVKSLSATLEADLNQARDVASRLEKDRADNATLYAIAANAKERRTDGSAFVDWIQNYFMSLAIEYRDRITRYRNTMETIERQIQSMESRETYTPQAISDVIHAQHASFMALAAQVAALHAEVENLKKDYAKWYKQTHKSVRDPFGTMNHLAGSIVPP